jgi:hypothetical protein
VVVANGSLSSPLAPCRPSNGAAVDNVEQNGAVFTTEHRPLFLMKHGLALFFLSVLAAALALPQSATTPSNTPAKKTPAAPAKTTAKTASAAKKTTTPTPSKKGKSAKKTVVPAYRQMAPTPERYKEIQQALAEKGYLKSEPNGVWDDQSAEALRQFQTDQKLSPTGKLSSASLIALGLGPKTSGAIPNPPSKPVETPPVDSAPAPPAVIQQN